MQTAITEHVEVSAGSQQGQYAYIKQHYGTCMICQACGETTGCS